MDRSLRQHTRYMFPPCLLICQNYPNLKELDVIMGILESLTILCVFQRNYCIQYGRFRTIVIHIYVSLSYDATQLS